MTRWKYPQPGGRLGQIASIDEWTPFLRKLTDLLQHLEKTWQGHVAEVSHVAKTSGEAPELLMDLLGLHPTSVEFFQRIGFHQFFVDDYARFPVEGHDGSSGQRGARIVDRIAAGDDALYLQSLGISETIADIKDAKAMNVLWQHYVSGLPIPSLVQKDRRPRTRRSRPTTSSGCTTPRTADIQVEKYPGAAPTAMLYLMLRNALLLQLGNGAYQWLQTRSIYAPSLESALQSNPLLGVVPSTPPVSKIELMSVKVAKVVPAYAFPNASVADVIWAGRRRPKPKPPSCRSSAMRSRSSRRRPRRASSVASSSISIAVSTGSMRGRPVSSRSGCSSSGRPIRTSTGPRACISARSAGSRTCGQCAARRSSPTRCPNHCGRRRKTRAWYSRKTKCRGPRRCPRMRRPASAAEASRTRPSINHAAAAALLRNAYLTHSDSADADVLSNNLSSDRARRAQFVLEGMRNGQPIEALLGYQFERALHDRTSSSFANHDSPRTRAQ